MVTKILKWSRIQDSFRITPKIESMDVTKPVFELPGVGELNPTNCFLNPQQTVKLCSGESAIYYIQRIYIIILVGLRQSKSSTPS